MERIGYWNVSCSLTPSSWFAVRLSVRPDILRNSCQFNVKKKAVCKKVKKILNFFYFGFETFLQKMIHMQIWKTGKSKEVRAEGDAPCMHIYNVTGCTDCLKISLPSYQALVSLATLDQNKVNWIFFSFLPFQYDRRRQPTCKSYDPYRASDRGTQVPVSNGGVSVMPSPPQKFGSYKK